MSQFLAKFLLSGRRKTGNSFSTTELKYYAEARAIIDEDESTDSNAQTCDVYHRM